MSTHRVVVRAAVACVALCAALWPARAAAQGRSDRGLTPFRSEAEFAEYFRARYQDRRSYRRPESFVECTAPIVVAIDSSGQRKGNAIISGRVHAATAAGTPIANVTVGTAWLNSSVLTDANGAFGFKVPADSLGSSKPVTVFARAIGYQPRSSVVTLARGMRVTVEIPMCAAAMSLSQVVVTSSGAPQSTDAITNVQVGGVDEGDIVKRSGDLLIVLRRGRLFTIDVGTGRLRPVAAVDAFGPGINANGSWYDELLVSDNRVVVIGYSYARGGTEVGIFDLAPDGRLTYMDTYQLSGSDYYSSRNYASRLIGSRLIFYTPIYAWRGYRGDTVPRLPSVRRWRAPAAKGDTVPFARIAGVNRVFRIRAADTGSPPDMLHAVVSCDLRTTPMSCDATTVLGGAGHVFHVSQTAVYVAATAWRGRENAWPTTIYRIPLNGALPTAAVVTGTPLDQFSFLETGQSVSILLRENGRGDGMWRAERPATGLSLVRLSISDFRDGNRGVSADAYQVLPELSGRNDVQARFVGSHLVYGSGNTWFRRESPRDPLYVVGLRDRRITSLAVEHGVDRVEVMGNSAVVIGSDSADLHFTGIGLDQRPHLSHRFILRQASQGETRSHGFFYRPDAAGGSTGVIGLPVSTSGRAGYMQLTEGSASVFFLRNTGSSFDGIGALEAARVSPPADGCRASCVDWYGNARPLFIDDRIVALLGYELVEGRVSDGVVREVQRTSFAPAVVGVPRD